MVKNLIIKSSYCKLGNGKLKSNFGDLIRTTVLLDCIKEDFIWATDLRAKNLLKYFVDEKKIKIFEYFKDKKNFSFYNIYNVDNYISDKNLFNGLKGNWYGYIINLDDCLIYPENEMIKSIMPYTNSNLKISWQKALVEGMGFKWKQQDYALSKIKLDEIYDVGLNWQVHQDWKSKMWPKENWNKLEGILKKDFTVLWQQGRNNFDEYINWLSSCKTIVTCESLGLHLASALRKKVVAIIGAAKNDEFSYGRINFIKPKSRDCMPCNSPICKFEKNCLSEIDPEYVADKVKGIKII